MATNPFKRKLPLVEKNGTVEDMRTVYKARTKRN